MAIDNFYLYPPSTPSSPHVLVRTRRPAGPNAAQPAVDFADDLADAKADALHRAWHASTGAEGSPPEVLGQASPDLDDTCPDDRALLAVLGGEIDLFWTASQRHPTHLQVGTSVDEDGFWRWLDEFVSDRRLAELQRPATRIRARLLTEAELRFVDAPLLLVEDVDWLTAEEFDDLHRRGGLERLLAGIPPGLTQVPEAETLAVKLSLIEQALTEDHRHGDRRSAAFRASVLARFDPDAAGVLVERMVRESTPDDDLRGIAWALAYALHQLDAWPGRPALLARLRGEGRPLLGALLENLAQLAEP